jgi:alcohol dehydrogenase class IV
LQRLQEALGTQERVKGNFIGIGPHTPVQDVLDALHEIRKVGGIDCLVTLGGGSVTDAGKLIRFFLANSASTEDQVDTLWGDKKKSTQEDPKRSLRLLSA